MQIIGMIKVGRDEEMMVQVDVEKQFGGCLVRWMYRR